MGKIGLWDFAAATFDDESERKARAPSSCFPFVSLL
jgi:hypothetical protein